MFIEVSTSKEETAQLRRENNALSAEKNNMAAKIFFACPTLSRSFTFSFMDPRLEEKNLFEGSMIWIKRCRELDSILSVGSPGSRVK